QRPEQVLVSRVAHLVREMGGRYGTSADRRWLTAQPAEAFVRAATVLQKAGVGRFAAVELAEESRGPRTVGVYRRVGEDRVGLFRGIDLRVARYEQVAGPAADPGPRGNR
ncbi:MAG: hypothetical protein C4344_01405, partial [Acidimicrobiia bacterium]